MAPLLGWVFFYIITFLVTSIQPEYDVIMLYTFLLLFYNDSKGVELLYLWYGFMRLQNSFWLFVQHSRATAAASHKSKTKKSTSTNNVLLLNIRSWTIIMFFMTPSRSFLFLLALRVLLLFYLSSFLRLLRCINLTRWDICFVLNHRWNRWESLTFLADWIFPSRSCRRLVLTFK